MKETLNIVRHAVSMDEPESAYPSGLNDTWAAVEGTFDTTESAQLVDVSEQGEGATRKVTSRNCDCESNAKATTVSQIEKGFSVDTMRQPTYDDSDSRMRQSKPTGPFDVIHQEYYVHQRNCKIERRMSSLSMGSAKASRRERYLSSEEQYEMLKLHHLNLLNEIHETALMLNLFEQRQLIREQQLKMRQIQNIQLIENSESERYYNQENLPSMKSSNVLHDKEHEVFPTNVISSKRTIEESSSPNKRQK